MKLRLGELPGEPGHLRTVGRRLVGDDNVDIGGIPENTGEAPQHAIGAADDICTERCVSLIKPRGKADAARDGIEFGHAQAMLGQEQVGTDDTRQVVFQGRGSHQNDEVGGFALIQTARHPVGLFPFGALAVEQIDRAIELQEDAAEFFQLLREIRSEGKRGRGGAPLVPGKEAFGGKCLSNG